MAAFDQHISDKFSLARILDELFYERTSPQEIFSFLQMYGDDSLKDFCLNSDCFGRIFQLDFLLELDKYGQEWIVEHLKKIPMRLAAGLAWQVCASNSGAADMLKYKFRKSFDWVLKAAKLRHPYATTRAKDSRPIDAIIFKAINHHDICAAANAFDDDMFVDFIRFKPTSSMFLERMFQEDFFESLNLTKAYALVKSMSLTEDFNIQYHFTRQILNQDIAVEIKQTVVGEYQNTAIANPTVHDALMHIAFGENDEIARIYKSAKEINTKIDVPPNATFSPVNLINIGSTAIILKNSPPNRFNLLIIFDR